eukprot:CAMPEP_0172320058 /NCGR_PEP_ID=MMETSP1058-20130122/39480_1 /TAXON_ID=83371 /ORGANISM="Detonula confervacea, Strain CCMP 353" /LENGTH=567 /DNA_ID=CAMNT_0013035241 /DNA_START=431 /DNA_END=2134 /DNA_ORIENTATION=+
MPPSDDEENKSPFPTKNKVAMYASQISQSATIGISNSNISPVPTHKNIKSMYGQLLTPAPGRLTPTGQGRIKAPPVCTALSLKRVASSMEEFNTAGVCFLPKEAESCAEKALVMDGKDGSGNNNGSRGNLELMPLNLEKCDAGFSLKSDVEPVAGTVAASVAPSTLEGNKAHHQFVSSNSTVVTTCSGSSCGNSMVTMSSCGRSAIENETASVASVAAKRDPPLEVVRTDSAVNSEDEHLGGGGNGIVAVDQQSHDVSGKSVAMEIDKSSQPTAVAPEPSSSSKPLSNTFTNNLIKDNLSRQGRSLQRWLVHSPTEELVRQVAGTIPITRDGRIVLVSASRKTEWILPKGGWDEDETREECAARETFEEAGLIGRLGGCLEPIDYETNKAKKRRLSKICVGGSGVGNGGESKSGGKVEGREREGCEGSRPPLPKRVKTGATASKAGSSDSICSSNACSAKSYQTIAASHPPPSTPAATTTPFDPSKYSYVRLFLFPLYVSSVKSSWPEKGRLRKIVDIDEAIKIMEVENRPYFRRGLEMVKERGLHLLMKQEGQQSVGQSENEEGGE